MKKEDFLTHAMLDCTHSLAGAYLSGFSYPWDAVGTIREFVGELTQRLDGSYSERAPGVWVHAEASVDGSARLVGPCILGAGCEVRTGAFVRGGVLCGAGCVVGNSTELKNCILFDGVQVPHFNYVGDSILGYRAHFGAGAVTSNLKADRSEVVLHLDGAPIETGKKKLGAIVGDYAEVGCNAVLCPGTVVGRRTTVYPLTLCRGFYPADVIVKHGAVVEKR